MTSAERTYSRGQGSRESSIDRTLEISVYEEPKIYNPDRGDGRLTIDDLELSQYAADDLQIPKRPNSAVEKSLQNLSMSVNTGVARRLKANPRQEMRPGSSRSRIPVPVQRNNNTRSPSPFFRNVLSLS